ncbi:MAG: hypothetical protein J7M25_05180 [Deltaproteobacteria bacterium]|nr:hypothetical protein [Deltaproteobacteria bacterium]
MGLFDKLFGRKKDSPAASPQEPEPAAAGEVTPSTDAREPKTEDRHQDTSDVVESQAVESDKQATTDASDEPASVATAEETATEAAAEEAEKNEPAEAAGNTNPPHMAAATIVCSGCGRDLPVPLPGHPTTIVCPFCTAQTDYTP